MSGSWWTDALFTVACPKASTETHIVFVVWRGEAVFLKLDTRGQQTTSSTVLQLVAFSYILFTIPIDCCSSHGMTLELCLTGWKIPNDSELYFIHILVAFSVPGNSLGIGNLKKMNKTTSTCKESRI